MCAEAPCEASSRQACQSPPRVGEVPLVRGRVRHFRQKKSVYGIHRSVARLRARRSNRSPPCRCRLSRSSPRRRWTSPQHSRHRPLRSPARARRRPGPIGKTSPPHHPCSPLARQRQEQRCRHPQRRLWLPRQPRPEHHRRLHRPRSRCRRPRLRQRQRSGRYDLRSRSRHSPLHQDCRHRRHDHPRNPKRPQAPGKSNRLCPPPQPRRQHHRHDRLRARCHPRRSPAIAIPGPPRAGPGTRRTARTSPGGKGKKPDKSHRDNEILKVPVIPLLVIADLIRNPVRPDCMDAGSSPA